MPNYTCTTVESVLDRNVKAALAAEIARIHAEVNRVPERYVNVLFSELPAVSVFSGGVPSAPLIVNGWVRAGHPDAETTRLALAIADAASRVTGLPPERVTVVFISSPAHYAVEGGRVLPAPGNEAAWAMAGSDDRAECAR